MCLGRFLMIVCCVFLDLYLCIIVLVVSILIFICLCFRVAIVTFSVCDLLEV